MTSSGTSSSAAPRISRTTSSPDLVALVGRHLDEHLVVDLEDQPAREPAALERLVDAHQRDLEDVGREALDAGVHRLALARLADPPVGVEQLGDRPPAPEQRLGVADLAGLDHGAVHVRLDVRERLEVGVEDDRRLLGGDAEPLAEAVRLHPVGEPVRDHLRLRALVEGDRLRLDLNTRAAVALWMSCPLVNASIRPGVVGEVGDAAQLDLVVVGDQQLVPGARHERGAEHATLLAAHRDVVQVRAGRS